MKLDCANRRTPERCDRDPGVPARPARSRRVGGIELWHVRSLAFRGGRMRERRVEVFVARLAVRPGCLSHGQDTRVDLGRLAGLLRPSRPSRSAGASHDRPSRFSFSASFRSPLPSDLWGRGAGARPSSFMPWPWVSPGGLSDSGSTPRGRARSWTMTGSWSVTRRSSWERCTAFCWRGCSSRGALPGIRMPKRRRTTAALRSDQPRSAVDFNLQLRPCRVPAPTGSPLSTRTSIDRRPQPPGRKGTLIS